MLEILLAGGGKAGPVAIPAVHRARPCPVLGLFLYVWVFFILFFLFGRVVVVVGLAASLRTGCRFVKGVSCVRGQTQWTVVVVWGPRSLSPRRRERALGDWGRWTRRCAGYRCGALCVSQC